jgi:hypothetical protein
MIDASFGGDLTMIALFGGPIPAPHTTAGSGDGMVGVIAILLFAIAVTVALVYANHPAMSRAVVKETPVETQHRMAA